MRKHLIKLFLAAISCCNALPAFADIKLVPLASGFSQPVDIASPNDGTPRMFVVQQGGRIRIVQNGFLLTAPFLDLTTPTSLVATGGEMGLLGLAFHPNYASNGHFFVYFTGTTTAGVGANGDIVIARYTRSAANPNIADPASKVNIITIPHRKGAQNFDNHNGGALRFGPDGYLYAGVGDGGSGGDPFGSGQDRKVLLGKIIRLNVDGAAPYIPPTNPYAGSTCATTCPEIWAYGVRNPWRISFDRGTGDFYIGDVGQGAWEEINRQVAGATGGANYGWNVCEGNHRYPIQSPDQACVAPANYVAPLLEYAHSEGLSVTGGYVYRGPGAPDLTGKYVYGDFSFSKLWYANTTGTGITLMTGPTLSPQVSTFGEGPTGELYVANYSNGTVYSFSSSTDMTPDPIAFTPVIDAPIGTTVTSNIVRLTGLGASTPISISGAGGSYSVGTANATTCSGSYTSSAGVISVDATICVRHTSANTGSTSRTSTLTIGNTDIPFTTTTQVVVPPTLFDVTPSIVGNGFLSPMGVQQVQEGQTTFFSITPAAGNGVVVTGTCGGTLNGTNYTTNPITANCTVIATFSPITYAVTPSAGAGGSISPNTVQNIAQGATTTFTVSPLIGYTASVGGTCGGTLVTDTYTTNPITAPCTVAATFIAIPITPPGAPTIGTAVAGDARASVSFTPPASSGGSAISQYTVTCGGLTGSGLQSPITVTGLANGMLYSCSVTATNSAGTGPPSATVDVTPSDMSALALVAVQSRRIHGGVTPYDVQIDHTQAIAGPVSVEPRMTGNSHQIAFQFNVPVATVDPAVAVDGLGASVAVLGTAISGNEVVVTLGGLADRQRASVTLQMIQPSNGTSPVPTLSASLGFLTGDVNHSRSVNASDISAVKARAAASLTLSNFRFDLNASGAIDATDVAAAKARSGSVIP